MEKKFESNGYQRSEGNRQEQRTNRPYSNNRSSEGNYRNSTRQNSSYSSSRDDRQNSNYRKNSYHNDGSEYKRYDNRQNSNNSEGGYQRREYKPSSYNNSERGGERSGERSGYRSYDNRQNSNSEGGYQRREYKPNSYNNSGYQRRDGEFKSNSFNNRQRGDSYDPNAKYSQKKQMAYKKQFVDYSQPMRLNKFLANSGICSRREADEYITAGVVTVNGEPISELGHKIIPATDKVMFHDQPVRVERKVYILLNKPKDCVTTVEDTHDRMTVLDLVKNACSERVYPVGRLDRNTTGVLLITNDGDLTSKLTHPKYDKKKIYHAVLDKDLSDDDYEKIKSGIVLEDGEIKVDELEFVNEDDRRNIGVEIHSGRNRIVRRIFDSLGYRVMRLDRVYFAGLTKKNLPRGKWRFLSDMEVNMLKMSAASMK